jgi:hypothetical protein
VAAAVGAVIGVACGLTAGLVLATFRLHAASSCNAIRAVAGCGAGLPPATWVVVLAAGSGRFAPLPIALTVMTVALASALGPRAFYGKPRRANRHHTARAESA